MGLHARVWLWVVRKIYTLCNETNQKEIKMTWKDKLKQAWDDNPLMVIGIGVVAVTAAAKLIDSVSVAQGRRAYARQVDYRINSKVS